MDNLSEAQIKNFSLIMKIGEGSTASVILAKINEKKSLCALKAIQKHNEMTKQDIQRLIVEQEIFSGLNHPFFVNILQSFQTRKHFFFALEYCPGGDLYTNLHMNDSFSEQRILFYAVQIVLAVEYLHSKNIIYRDLKPQNILIGKDGYLKLTDFGLSQLNISQDDTKIFSNHGTTQYTSPQMIKGQGHGRAYDWWMLGCCLYEMVYKISPFYSDHRQEMFEKIQNSQPFFNQRISQNLKNLIQGLLNKNPSKRLEFAKTIKNNKCFANINFDKIIKKQETAPYIPDISRGKKLLKINKNEVSIFNDFKNVKLTKNNYIEGFDFNCQKIQQQETTSTLQSSAKRLRKMSTDDDSEQDKQSIQSLNKLPQNEKKRKSMF